MDSGLYAAVNGALRTEKRMSVIANNLANVNTNGFKEGRISFDSYLTAAGPEYFPLPTDSFMGLRGPGDIPFPYSNVASNAYQMTYPMATETTDNLSQGALLETGNPLDVAIEGKGFFAIQTPEGRRYTRDGSFAINTQGQLTTKDGFPVLGADGGLLQVIDPDEPVNNGKKGNRTELVEINPDGSVANGEGILGQLSLIDLPQAVLKKEGLKLYSAPVELETPVEAREGRFHRGYLESSNANVVHSMTKMIESNRTYETHMKMIKALDELDKQAATQIGKLA
ncbi:flagellar basal-body rod protein FlgF [Magnetococcales bacterium HHB-1]